MANKHHLRNQVEIEALHKDAFTFCWQTGGFDFTWHKHPQHHQLIYAENGVVHIDTAERTFLLPARHGAWIPANLAHSLSSDTPALQLWLLYFREQASTHDALCRLRIFFISTLAREMIVFTNRWSEEGAASELERSFYATLRLLAVEWCSQSLPLMLPIANEPLLLEVTAFIQHNLATPLQTASIADRYGVSCRTLLRMFHKHLGMTVGEYVRIARMVRAVELLTQPAISVTEVAHAVGYNSLSSFGQMFRQLMGVTPYAYMRGKGAKK